MEYYIISCYLVVEDLLKIRQPMPKYDVVYFITPKKKSIDQVIDDFADRRKYNKVHIFFTDSKYIADTLINCYWLLCHLFSIGMQIIEKNIDS